MKYDKNSLLISYILFAVFFVMIFYFKILVLQSAMLFLLVFFVPGFLATPFLGKQNILKIILCSIIFSVTVTVFSIVFLNIALKIPFDANFVLVLFVSTTAPQIVLLFVKKIQLEKPDFSVDKWLLVIFAFAILAESVLFFKIGTLMGPDVGRFASISHAYFLEKNIVLNLQPYDLASKYFYFPGVIVLPAVFEIVGINPIVAMTLIGLIINLATILAFYFFSKELLGEYALHATLFFAFLFNIPLYFILFAFQPFGMSYLFLFAFLASMLAVFFNKNEKSFLILTFSFLGILFFHPYIIFLLLTFITALFIYDFVENGKKFLNFRRMFFASLLPVVAALILFSPYLFYFRDSLAISFSKINKIDVSSYRPLALFGFVNSEAARNILTVLFSIPVGFVDPIYLIVAFAIFLIAWKKFVQNEKKILAIFFILTIGLNYFAASNINLSRFLTSTSVFYPNVMPILLNFIPLNLVFVGASMFFNSPSLLFYLKNLQPTADPGSSAKTVVWPEFNDAMNFIAQNTSENATFLIDGGGAGCLGLSSSYGERIFPLTSRKVFYFTNYCWADYNRTDYSERVDAYREIAETPSDLSAIQILKSYNVTHVFIGPDDFILNPDMFLNSNYRTVFHENKIYIFQLN